MEAKTSSSRKRKLCQNANKWKKMREELETTLEEKGEHSSVGLVTTKVVAIDCEYVGVGPSGLENMLARVSIVNIDGNSIYNKFVRQTEDVTDYRTEISGIRPGHLIKHGIPFAQVQSEVRKILADNIVVGHSVHNDFKVLGLTHPPKLIRDTAKYKPLRETLGDPNKTPSLKLLAQCLLGEEIQQGEHDSVKDAQIALRIYLKHREKWEKTKKGPKRK